MRGKMKNSSIHKLTLLLTTAILMACSVVAAEDNQVKNSLKKGSKSLQFRVERNFSLSSFDGAGITGKWHKTDKSALRFGVSFYYSDTDEDSDNNRYVSTIRDSNDSNNKNQSTTVKLSSRYLYYFTTDEKVNAFIGMGPSLVYSWRESNDETVSPPHFINDSLTSESSRLLSRESKSWIYSADLSCGVEWFASENISFFGEYTLCISYKTYSSIYDLSSVYIKRNTLTDEIITERHMNSCDNSDGNTFGTSASDVQIGLSVYF